MNNPTREGPPIPDWMRQYVIAELDAALAEMRTPNEQGIIAENIIEHARALLAAWPDLTDYGHQRILLLKNLEQFNEYGAVDYGG